MKKQLLAAIAALSFTAVPAMAQQANLAVNLDGQVPQQCGVHMYSGLAGAESTATGANTVSVARGLGGTFHDDAALSVGLGSLAPAGGSATIGSLSAICNSGNAVVSITTDNGFELSNGSDSIPFDLTVSGSGSSASFNTASSYTAGGANQPGGNTRTLGINYSAFSALSISPGSYTDMVRVTVAPSP